MYIGLYLTHISANQAGIYVTERSNPNLLLYHSQWNQFIHRPTPVCDTTETNKSHMG